eukprot:PITA_14401
MFRSTLTKDDCQRIRRHSQPYRIIGDTLYRVSVDSVLRQCLTIKEAERVLNDFHSKSCRGYMSSYATTEKILCAGYFWSSIFKDCILDVHKCHECQIYQCKMCAPTAQLHPIIIIGPFAKWGIDYMTHNPRSVEGQGYIIIVVDYRTKWTEAMPTYSVDGKTAAQFLSNHVIYRFNVPQAIVTDHGPHFRDHMMAELTSALGLRHDGSTPYYPQANIQVEAMNRVLVTTLQPTLLIECEIPSLNLDVELLPKTSPQEEHLLYLEQLDKTRRPATLVIKAQKKQVKSHFDQSVSPRAFSEGDLVLLYDQASDKLGAGKFEPMWHETYIMKCVLQKGDYEIIDYERNPLDKPRNRIYLKKYYA